jgi:hypothetical protein
MANGFGTPPWAQGSQNPFVVEQPQPEQQQAGMNPLQGLQAYQQFSGGGMFGGGAAGGGAGAASGSAGSAAGGAGGGAAGGGSSALASAGPWAALAAVIIANEYGAKEGGRRRSGSDYYKDLLGGKVLEQDAPYWSQKMFGSSDKAGLGADFEAGAELATLDFSNFFDKAKQGTLGKLLGLD